MYTNNAQGHKAGKPNSFYHFIYNYIHKRLFNIFIHNTYTQYKTMSTPMD